MKRKYQKKNVEKAKHLRKNMTDAEEKLWYHLRKKNLDDYKFRRQQPIDKYIVECFEKKFIVELDGGQHQKNKTYDDERTDRLNSEGFTVLRFWNNEVLKEIDKVLEQILKGLDES